MRPLRVMPVGLQGDISNGRTGGAYGLFVTDSGVDMVQVCIDEGHQAIGGTISRYATALLFMLQEPQCGDCGRKLYTCLTDRRSSGLQLLYAFTGGPALLICSTFTLWRDTSAFQHRRNCAINICSSYQCFGFERSS